jgi:YidC/Oxa1 family membrane protein insertase
MPIMFTFIMAPFAAGLIIYWTWNNVLSILQQYIIMHRYKVDNPIDDFIGRFRSKPVG